MSHVFVETNWLFDYAAPAHHQSPAAAALLDRAQRGEFIIHVPNLCFGEARQAIRKKCQPREADPIRKFLTAEPADHVTKTEATATRVVPDKYQSSIKRDLQSLDNTLRTLASLPYIQVFSLDGMMLRRATELVLEGIVSRLLIRPCLRASWSEPRACG